MTKWLIIKHINCVLDLHLKPYLTQSCGEYTRVGQSINWWTPSIIVYNKVTVKNAPIGESLCAQDLAIQKPDQNRNNMSHSLYNHPYALNHIQLVNWTFHNYEVSIFKVLAIIYHRFHAET